MYALVRSLVPKNSTVQKLVGLLWRIKFLKESAEDLPDYYLLLAHNFADEIIDRNKNLINDGVKFIIPFPEIKIVWTFHQI